MFRDPVSDVGRAQAHPAPSEHDVAGGFTLMKPLISALLPLFLSACGHSESALPIPPFPTPPASFIADMRAVTPYLLNGRLGQGNNITIDYLTANLPAIKNVGFNAIYLPLIWMDFDPNPIASPRTYNEAAFNDLRSIISLLRANGMKLVSGLDYVGDGFAPNIGVQACAWSTTPSVYASFEQYVSYLLTSVGNGDMWLPMVFTEGAEGCGMVGPQFGPQVALQLQTTLGSLPSRLPPATRAAFRIGYHDYTLIAKGWGRGNSPIASPISFDWVSMAAYNADVSTMTDMRSRFAALYPATPFAVMELGSSSCPAPYSDQTQAAGDVAGVQYALANGYGFNVWGWTPGGNIPPYDDCTNPVYGGLAITNPDGSLKSAAQQLKLLLSQ